MRILVTGFAKFPGVPVNPTELLIEKWRSRPPSISSCEFIFEVLPTEYVTAGQLVTKQLGDESVAGALMLGVANQRQLLAIERFALNIDDSSVPDAGGEVRQGRVISVSAPAALRTSVPVDQIREAMVLRGVSAEISNHAGTYVCNHVYFRALEYVAAHASSKRVLFCHMPMTPLKVTREWYQGGMLSVLDRWATQLLRQFVLSCR